MPRRSRNGPLLHCGTAPRSPQAVYPLSVTQALYRRYRPETFTEVIGQEHVTEPLMQALRAGKITHAYLFSGPRGCGKTTSARILARCLNCAQGPTPTPCGECDSCRELGRGGPGSLDVVEIDAASHNGVDDARDLRERAAFAPARDGFKIFILDEPHMVTPQGLNALLNWMFIWGHWGAPALGLTGSGVATLIARTLAVSAIARVPLVAFVAVRVTLLPALSGLIDDPPAFRRRTMRMLQVAVPTGLVAVLAMAGIGPAVVSRVFAYDVARMDAAVVALSSVTMMASMTLTTALIAASRSIAAGRGLALGCLAYGSMLALPVEPMLRVELAMVVGGLVAALAQWRALPE